MSNTQYQIDPHTFTHRPVWDIRTLNTTGQPVGTTLNNRGAEVTIFVFNELLFPTEEAALNKLLEMATANVANHRARLKKAQLKLTSARKKLKKYKEKHP